MSKILIKEGELKSIIRNVLNEHLEYEKPVKKNQNIIAEKIKKIVENILNEWTPKAGFNTWADIETGGAHSKGIQHRKNFTRKENAKTEKVSELKTVNDFIRVISQAGLGSDDKPEKIFKILIRRYKNGTLSLNDLNRIAQIDDFKNSYISNKLLEFIQEEGLQTGYITKHSKQIVDNQQNQKLQPKNNNIINTRK